MELPALQSHYQNLKQAVRSGRDGTDAKECWDVLTEYIRETCETEAHRALVASLVLDDKDGLFPVLEASMKSQGKEASKLHIEMLHFIAKLLEDLRQTLGAIYANHVLDRCVFLFKRCELNSVKCATLEPVFVVLSWDKNVLEKCSVDVCAMATSYQREYTVNRKLTNSAKGGLLQVMGLLFDLYSDEFHFGHQFNCKWLQEECLRVLEKSKKEKLPEPFIAGAMSGMAATLKHEDGYSPQAEQTAYSHIKKTLHPENVQAATRYLGIKSAMKLLQQCAPAFGASLVTDIFELLDFLVALRSQHQNKEVRDAADDALHAVFKQVSIHLTSGDVQQEVALDTVQRLLHIFTKILLDTNSNPREVNASVKGIGYFAKPFAKYVGQQGLDRLMQCLAPLVSSGHGLESIEDLAQARLDGDKSLLLALAHILSERDTVDLAAMDMCKEVVSRIIGSYLNLWPVQRSSVHSSIVMMLLSFKNMPAVQEALMQFVINVLLTTTLNPPSDRIISGPLSVLPVEEVLKDGWRHFVEFWLALLNGEKLTNEATEELQTQGGNGNFDGLNTLAYDCLVRSVLDAVRNLEVGYTAIKDDSQESKENAEWHRNLSGPDESEVLVAESGSGLIPNNAEDFKSFLNLAGFVCDVIPQCGSERFKQWSHTMTVELVTAAGRHPLLSGFYKMLTEVVKLCDSCGMFDAKHADDMNEDPDPDPHNDRYVMQLCIAVYKEFLQELLVACRRYTGDLLCACLGLLLSCPGSLLPAHQLATPLKLALTLGLQYPEVASVAINALESMEGGGNKGLDKMLQDVMPLLEPYLRECKEKRKTGNVQSRSLTPKLKSDREGFQSIQCRMQLWLGRCGGLNQHMLIAGKSNKSEVSGEGRWDPEDKVGIQVSFPTLESPSILWMDSLVCQAAILAESSANRSTRVAACEFLHATILWMIGTNARRPIARNDEDFKPVPTKFHKILKRLFPIVVRLGVSPELVARQLFQPLLMTLIHWLTRSARREAAETMCLLDAIMTGLGDESSGAVRELCSTATAEFLKWSAKHLPAGSGASTLHANNLNAASLLRRLFDRLSHPEPYNRLGASLALGHCARILRSEQDLMDCYILESLYYCVHALRLAEGDALGSGTLKQATHALSAIVHHCLKKCARALKEENTERLGFVNLDSFLDWLWNSTNSTEACCRRRSMLLHDRLANECQEEGSMETDVGASGEWFSNQLDRKGLNRNSELQKFLNVTVKYPGEANGETTSIITLKNWLKALSAALEWSVWAIEQRIMVSSDIMRLQNSNSTTRVVHALFTFLKMIPDPCSISSDAWSFTVGSLAGCEKESHELVLSILDFMRTVDMECFTQGSGSFLNFLMACLFAPGLIGLRVFKGNLHSAICRSACLILQRYLQNSSVLVESDCKQRIDHLVATTLSIAQGGSQSDADSLRKIHPSTLATISTGVGLLLGVKDSCKLPIVSQSLTRNLPDQCLAMVVSMVHAGNMSHLLRHAAEGCLALAVQLGLSPNALLGILLEDSKGLALYNVFPAVIHRWILFNAEACCAKLCSAIAKQDGVSMTAETILMGTLESLSHAKLLSGRRDPAQSSFLRAIVLNFSVLELLAKSQSGGKANLSGVKTIVRLLKKLMDIDRDQVLSQDNPGFSFILDTYTSLLALRSAEHASIRCEALQLLPSFLSMSSSSVDKVIKAVDSMITDVFPPTTSTLTRRTRPAREYAVQLNAILSAAVHVTQQHKGDVTTKVLEGLLQVMQELGTANGHIYQKSVETKLALIASSPWTQSPNPLTNPPAPSIAQDSAKTANSLIQYCWNLAFETVRISPALRSSITKHLLVPCLEFASSDVCEAFFTERIRPIVRTAKEGGQLDAGNEGSRLAMKLCAFMLLEVMYRVLSKQILDSKVLCQLEKKNQTVMKLAVTQAKQADTVLPGNTDLQRQICCASFSAASSLLVATQTNPKFFSLPFQGSIKGAPPTQLWQNLMDTRRTLSFSVEMAGEGTDAQIERAATAVARVKQQKAAGLTWEMGETLGSLNLMQSTLGVKIAASQFSIGMDDAQPENETGQEAAEKVPEEGPSTPQKTQQPSSLEIWGSSEKTERMNATSKDGPGVDMGLVFCDDELDKHEAMLALVKLLEKAGDLQCGNEQDLPVWPILASLNSAVVPKYSKLFLCKAIIHLETRHMEKQARQSETNPKDTSTDFDHSRHSAMELDIENDDEAEQQDKTPALVPTASTSNSVFSRFAPQFFPAMVEAILDEASDDNTTEGGKFHYLLRDVCLVFLRWSKVFEKTEVGLKYETEIGEAARKLLRHLVLVGYSANADVVRVNFEYLKAFIAQWRKHVPLSVDAVLMHLAVPKSDGGRKSQSSLKQAIFGLKVLGVALSYGQGETLVDSEESDRLWKGVTKVLNLQKMGMRLGRQAGETTGLILKAVQKHESLFLPIAQIEQEVKEAVCQMCWRREYAGAISFVQRMAAFYPSIVDVTKTSIMDSLMKVEGPLRHAALDTLRQRARNMPDLFIDVARDDIIGQMLHSKFPNVQCSFIGLVKDLIQTQPYNVTEKAVQKIVKAFISHTDETCRHALFELLRSAWQSWPEADRVSLQGPLMVLLADNSETVRRAAVAFWNAELPQSMPERLRELLRLSVRPGHPWTEMLQSRWPQVTSILLLELPKLSPDYDHRIFENSLAECKFMDYSIDTWQGRSSTGLFTMGTTVSQSQEMGGGSRIVDSGSLSTQGSPQKIRATMTSILSPTVALSLPFESSEDNSMTQHPAGSTALGSSPTKPQRALLTRRIYKASGRNSGIGAQLRRKAAEKRRQDMRQSKIELYRSYRSGELPDIQGVKPSGFLGPLAIMVENDNAAGCMVVACIARTISDEVQERNMDRQVLVEIRALLNECFATKLSHGGYVQCLASIAGADRGCWINPESILACARSSGEYQCMTFLLEQQILYSNKSQSIPMQQTPSRSSRGHKTAESNARHPIKPAICSKDNAWQHLSQLYQDMGEGDWLHVIRMQHLTKCPGSRTALSALQNGRGKTALKIYDQLLDAYEAGGMELDSQCEGLLGVSEVSEDEVNIWYDDKIKCMEKMGCWKALHDQVKIELLEEGEEERPDPKYDRLISGKPDDQHLSRYLRSFVRCCLFNPADHPVLSNFLQAIGSDSSKMATLQRLVPGELLCFRTVCLQWERAQAELLAVLKTFIHQWGGTSARNLNARCNMLSMLQPIAEVHELVSRVLQCRLEDGTISVPFSEIGRTVNGWLDRWPSSFESVDDSIVTVTNIRELMIKHVHTVLERRSHVRMNKLISIIKLQAVSRLCSQGLTDIAEELLDQHNADIIGHETVESLPRTLTSLELRIAQVKQSLNDNRLHVLLARDLQGMMNCRGELMEDSVSVDFRVRGLIAQAEGLLLSAKQPGVLDAVQMARTSEGLKQWMSCVESASGRCKESEQVAKAALGCALLYNDLATGGTEGAASNALQISEKVLSAEVKGSIAEHGGVKSLLVKNLLLAIAYGSSDAALYVPTMLMAMLGDQNACSAFDENWQRVPLSSFLPWIAQMLSQVETPACPSLIQCLNEIADHHPQHLYFPFKLCEQHLTATGIARTQELRDKMKIPVLMEFSRALHKLTYPVQRWDGYEAYILRQLQSGNKEEAVRIYREAALPDLFGDDACETPRGRGGRNNVNSKFQSAYKSKFISVFGPDGRSIRSMDGDSFRKKSKKLTEKLKEELRSESGQRELTVFTPWFEEFTNPATNLSKGDSDGVLLMPKMACTGTGARDVAIVGFGKTVDIFSSKQKPKKLTVYAEDFSVHEFVVKGGEELRIDQRVEQIFSVMNGLSARHPPSASRNLSVHTYDVIPISPTLGLLAFVPGTRPLESVMVPCSISEASYRKSAASYQQYIAKSMGGYERALGKGNRDNVVKAFEQVQSVVPWDGLKEAFVRYSGSPEGFLSFRKTFLKSLSATCVMGYIVGVGDRHLQNFLIEERTGQLIPIDFGYSFGTATQVLPIPELMPFRLTRQMLNVFAPHEGTSVLEVNMKEVMEALRNGRQVIEGIMAAFLKEPILDWQREAQLLARVKGKKVPQGDVVQHEEMHAQLKVEFSQRKLRGYHPGEIMLAELSGRHRHKPYWKNLESIVRGDPKHNARARVPFGECASGVEQIKCLLDQATDPNILGRTWEGWRPWI